MPSVGLDTAGNYYINTEFYIIDIIIQGRNRFADFKHNDYHYYILHSSRIVCS